MSTETRLRNAGRGAASGALVGLGCGVPIALSYCALTIGVNAIAVPVVAAGNGIERLLGARNQEYTATLQEQGAWDLHSSRAGVLPFPDMPLKWGEFELEDGRTITVSDMSDIPSGKFFANTRMGSLEVGQAYDINIIGSDLTGYKLLTAKPAEEKQK